MNGVQVEMSLVHDAENEATVVKHELEEPKGQTFHVDSFLSVDMDSDVKFYGQNNFHRRAECGRRSNKGGLHSYIAQQGEDELNFGALDGILDEIDEVEGDAAAQSLAAACKDYLLDLDFTQEISALNHHPHNEIQIENSSSEIRSPGCSGSSNGAGAMSESLAGTDPEHNGHNGTCKETISCGMNIDCKNQSGHAQRGEFNNRLDSSNFGKPNDLWNMTTTSITVPSYGRNTSVEASTDDADLRQKRQRKPTKRLIEESMDTKSSRHIHAAEKLVTAASEGQRPWGRPPGRMGKVASGMLVSLHVEESWEEDDRNTSSHTYARRVRSQEHEIFMEYEVEESFVDQSEDAIVKKKSKKGGDRRKHQRMRTLPEVTKLVNGISEFGVGRWTQIKRLSFAASAHRTPIDLRDKWRNLLRASYAKKPNNGVNEDEKNSGRPLPNPLLCHVRELASLHPYPRNNASRSPSLPRGKNASRSSSLPGGKNCAEGRNVCRRSNT